MGVPGIEFFTWPDQWYHADTDTPDKSDPTEMKRIAFIGAACAWAAANCSDAVLPGLIDAVSEFSYQRVAKQAHPQALHFIESAESKNLNASLKKSLNLIQFATTREIGALQSIAEIYSGSAEA